MDQVPAEAALTEFVLKVHARCDLACDHCYVYEHAGPELAPPTGTWRRRPAAAAAGGSPSTPARTGSTGSR